MSIELEKAIELGYRVIDIEVVWHFEHSEQYDRETKTGGLFTEYINTFLKLKVEASGWPSWVVSEQDKTQYLNDYYEHEGIHLDAPKITKNPGLRALAKLMLNSFWGKFGQRINMSKVEVISDPAKLYDILLADDKIVHDINFINHEIAEVRYEAEEEFVEPNAKTDVVIAAFTTAHARLKLYELLEQLQESVLYYDTDSVLYVTKPGQYNPPEGD